MASQFDSNQYSHQRNNNGDLLLDDDNSLEDLMLQQDTSTMLPDRSNDQNQLQNKRQNSAKDGSTTANNFRPYKKKDFIAQ